MKQALWYGKPMLRQVQNHENIRDLATSLALTQLLLIVPTWRALFDNKRFR